MAFDVGSLLGAASVASPAGQAGLAAGALGGAAGQAGASSSASNETTVNATQGAESRTNIGRIGGEFTTSFGGNANTSAGLPMWAYLAAAAAGLLILWRRR
jgi:hypothetical protein